jgi:hypothetical protein
VNETPLEEIWRRFDPANDEFFNVLFDVGPFGLLEEAEKQGYKREKAYADKCHLCMSIRRFLFDRGLRKSTIGPAECYAD